MDFSVGDIPIDIIIFALIAGFLVLRLRSVLGKKTGFEKKDTAILSVKAPSFLTNHKNKVPQTVEPPKPKTEFTFPVASTETGKTLQQINQLDSSFVPQKFLEGTEIVFRKVLTAFAKGDKQTLQSMLLPEAYTVFESAITRRQEEQEVQKIEIKLIHSIAVNKAQILDELSEKKAIIEVKIVSDQVNCVFDKDKNPIIGTESVTEFIDFWVFERVLGINNQGISWRLKSARTGS